MMTATERTDKSQDDKMARPFKYQAGDKPLKGYTIRHAAGRGGFGEVYFAESDGGREVAIKAIQANEQIELRGVQQCMNLKSPHLVSIFDVQHNEDGEAFVIMEYIHGPSLQDLINDEKKKGKKGLGEKKAAFFISEICKGLSILHESGIVHRDLKPGNIFFDQGMVKIGDYGLSKYVEESAYSAQTVTVGTVQYMAPEVARGEYNRSIDIYALGVMLYEMLTGETPFAGHTPGEILMRHLNDNPDLSQFQPPFQGTLRRSLAKSPAMRFQSADEMARSLVEYDHDPYASVSEYAANSRLKDGTRKTRSQTHKEDHTQDKVDKEYESAIKWQQRLKKVGVKIDVQKVGYEEDTGNPENKSGKKLKENIKLGRPTVFVVSEDDQEVFKEDLNIARIAKEQGRKTSEKQRQAPRNERGEHISPITRFSSLIFALLTVFQLNGIHRLFAGKYVTGVIWLFTGGLFFIGQFIDIIQILRGRFKDSEGRVIERWDRWDWDEMENDTFVKSFAINTTRIKSRLSWRRFFSGVSTILSWLLLAGTLMAGTALGLMIAIDVPGFLNTVIDQGERVSLRNAFGTGDVRFLLSTLFYGMLLACFSAFNLILFVKRLKKGIPHIARSFGAVALLLLTFLTIDIGSYIDWATIRDFLDADNLSGARDHFAKGLSPIHMLLAILFSFGGLTLLFWPHRMRAIEVTEPGADTKPENVNEKPAEPVTERA